MNRVLLFPQRDDAAASRDRDIELAFRQGQRRARKARLLQHFCLFCEGPRGRHYASCFLHTVLQDVDVSLEHEDGEEEVLP